MSGKSILTAFRKTRAQWLDIAVEIGIILAFYFLFRFLRGFIEPGPSTAVGNAQDIINLEKDLSIYRELDIQSFFLKSDFRVDVANILYTICYYPALIIFAIWGYWRHRAKYKYIRTVFIVSAALAFVVFALYPVAPPRFFDGNRTDIGAPDLGFVDTILTYWNLGEADQYDRAFSAMPSLHQAWTIMVGIGVWWMTKTWYGRSMAIILPLAMFVGITSTANHFVLDAVAGAALIGLAFGLTALIWKYKGALFPGYNGGADSPTDSRRPP